MTRRHPLASGGGQETGERQASPRRPGWSRGDADDDDAEKSEEEAKERSYEDSVRPPRPYTETAGEGRCARG